MGVLFTGAFEHFKFGLQKITYTKNDSGSKTIQLPIGAVILQIGVSVSEAFNATTNTISVGTEKSATKFFAAQAAGAVANAANSVFLTTTDDERTITVGYNGTGAAATAGKAEIGVYYALPSAREVDYR
ncbi:MAG: hypothetical protein LBN32_00355 [Helicobacteraceae bacterium]|jgi:hypothetical protein|nr:hypothetical protein [Helicobacteraceae bacterium]